MKSRHWVGLIGGIALCMLGLSASATVLPPEHCDDCTEQTYSFGFSWWDRVFSAPGPRNHGGGFNIRALFQNLFRNNSSHTWVAYNPVGHENIPGGGGCNDYVGGDSGGGGWGGDSGGVDDCTDKEAPEPGILGLLGIGLIGIVLARRRMTA